MVRNYVRKTDRKKYAKDVMIQAINDIKTDRKSLRLTAIKYQVPRTTLLRWCKIANTEEGLKSINEKMGRFRTVFSEEQENKFVEYLRDMRARLYPLTSNCIRQLAFQYAEMNNIPHKFNVETGLAGQDWLFNFMKRNEEFKLKGKETTLSIGNEPGTSANINRPNVDKFFDALAELKNTYHFLQTRIYNVSEGGIISIPKPPLNGESTGNLFDVVSTITCCNAAGHYIPPLMVFPTEEIDSSFTEGCPPDTEFTCHPSGWVQKDIFFPKWFDHFLDNVAPTAKRPILLLISGCVKHVVNLKFFEKARENHTHILCAPTGESFKLDPLECNFMVDLKSHYVEECKKWVQQNPTEPIGLKNVGKIYGAAYLKSATPLNAMHGFEFCGIHPFNRYVFSNEENVPQTEGEKEVNKVTVIPTVKKKTGAKSTNSVKKRAPKKFKTENLNIETPSETFVSENEFTPAQLELIPNPNRTNSFTTDSSSYNIPSNNTTVIHHTQVQPNNQNELPSNSITYVQHPDTTNYYFMTSTIQQAVSACENVQFEN